MDVVVDTEWEPSKMEPIPDAQCICGCTKRWIIWNNLLICDKCGKAYEMENSEMLHPAIFNRIREERLQK